MKNMRHNAAYLMLFVGLLYIARLWLFDLSTELLWGALIGLACLLTGLGLLGKSRTSLWLACLLSLSCLIMSYLAYRVTSTDFILLVTVVPHLLILYFSFIVIKQGYLKNI